MKRCEQGRPCLHPSKQETKALSPRSGTRPHVLDPADPACPEPVGPPGGPWWLWIRPWLQTTPQCTGGEKGQMGSTQIKTFWRAGDPCLQPLGAKLTRVPRQRAPMGQLAGAALASPRPPLPVLKKCGGQKLPQSGLVADRCLPPLPPSSSLPPTDISPLPAQQSAHWAAVAGQHGEV